MEMAQAIKAKDAEKGQKANGLVIDYAGSELSLGIVERDPFSGDLALNLNLMFNHEGLYKLIHEFPLGERNLRKLHKAIGTYLETGKL